MLLKVVYKLRKVSQCFFAILQCSQIFPEYLLKPQKRFDRPLLYKSGMDCFNQGLKYEGWQFCWKGLGPTLMRAFPANAALFFTYQFVSDYLYRLNPEHFRHLSTSARQNQVTTSWLNFDMLNMSCCSNCFLYKPIKILK